MNTVISPDRLAVLMSSAGLCAVFDVRERGEFNGCQIANATSLPRSQIEFRIAELAPNPLTPLVVYDDGEGRARFAAGTLAEHGYRDIAMLDGGLPAWRRGGFPTASGVNVPSKAFGEKVHRERMIPDISAEELKSLQDRNADLLVLDVRTPEEYARFSIPGGINVPGGDLILWAEVLKQRPETSVVVNCAGRTRSIIGAAALRRLNVQNTRALRNGTMGWVLAGFELESRPRRSVAPPHESRRQARDLALELARQENIPALSVRELLASRDAGETGSTYLIDVRSETEYASGHIPSSINVPGGQAVQRADDFIAVRNGRIVFISDRSARAIMAAYWYRAMGFANAAFLQGGLEEWIENRGELTFGAVEKAPLGLAEARAICRMLAPPLVESLLRSAPVQIIDVGSSLDFEAAHLPGAQWISRGWIELKLPGLLADSHRPVLVSCLDGQQSLLAARTLAEMGYQEVYVLDGGVRSWVSAGYTILRGLEPCLVEPNDVVLSPSIRGSKEDMRRYLEWELKLDRHG